jgi:hypothetical protein
MHAIHGNFSYYGIDIPEIYAQVAYYEGKRRYAIKMFRQYGNLMDALDWPPERAIFPRPVVFRHAERVTPDQLLPWAQKRGAPGLWNEGGAI